jgi:methyltransferase family protein
VGRKSVKGEIGARIRRAVAAVVDPRATEIRGELAALRGELQDTRESLRREIKTAEERRRRDIFYASDVRAAAETELFVAEHMTGVPSFARPRETLRHALSLVSIDGMALEFGVAGGKTLRSIVAGLPGREIFGFDVFTGLPEDWRPRFAQGRFAQQTIPSVPGATLIEGLFEDTLPSFLEDHPADVAFIHLDADLYSSTKTVLDLLGDRLVPGTVVLLDEYFNYPGWQEGEYRAWAEFVTGSGVRFAYRGFSYDNEQVVLTITGRGPESRPG